MPTLDDAIALDAADPIASLRHEFVIDEDGPIYADGNSLGRLSRRTRDAIRHLVDEEWGQALIASWEEWFDLPTSVGDLIGTSFLGAREGETVVADSTTVNFYKLAVAALRAAPPGRRVVLTDRSNFPTDRFVLQGIDADVVLLDDDPTPATVNVALAQHAGAVALVTLSHVSYRSGARLDMGAITRAAHDAGARVLWDLSHSVGSIAIDLTADQVDLAVGCTYKYLNGGPGAPAFLYVRADLHERLAQPVQGWFGAADQFAMGQEYAPAAGVRRFLSGTPPILGLRAVEAAVSTIADVGIDALAAKGEVLTSFVIDCVDDFLAPVGFSVASPRERSERGAHVAVRHDDAWRVCKALIEHEAVIPDFRGPDILRLGFAPAYTRFVDAFEAVLRVREIVDAGRHLAMSVERSRIT